MLAELDADPSVALAEELICFLPPAFGLEENQRLPADIAKMLRPQRKAASRFAELPVDVCCSMSSHGPAAAAIRRA